MKITKKELQQIIKEEAIKFKRKIELERELSEVKKQLDEVHAAGAMDSTKHDGVHAGQLEPEFTKKGSALVEDEMEEGFEGAEEKEEDEFSDFNLEEMLSEMLEEMNSEECEEEEEEMNEVSDMTEEEEEMNEVSDMTEEEEEEEEMPETPSHEDTDKNQVYESKEVKSDSILNEQRRMQELAGIKKDLL
jgi:hypothetical protein